VLPLKTLYEETAPKFSVTPNNVKKSVLHEKPAKAVYITQQKTTKLQVVMYEPKVATEFHN
jgi:hypothetical protein